MCNFNGLLKRNIEYLNDENVAIEVKNFYLTAFYTSFASILMVLVFIASGLPLETVEVSFGMFVFCLMVGFVAKYTEEYRLYTIVYVITFNFLIYPLYFFLTADIYNGVPLYLGMGIILTFFLTSGRTLFLLVSLEIICDSYWIYFSYHYRDSLKIYHNLSMMGTGITICFILASLLPLFIIYYQTIMYKKIHERISKSNNSLSAAGLDKSRFLANMTHEIRTPINAIFGMVEVILKEDLTDEAREQAETIKTASAELLNIINNILVYSKLDSGKMELLPTRYNFRELIEDVIHSVAIEYSNNQTDFSVFIDHNIPTFLYGDDIRIKQVLRYLMFSSLHQLPRGRISFEVMCEKNEKEHTATFKCKISESGRGLTESELKAVFGAYNEYDSRQRSDFKGMGLELFICRELLNLMDGSLKIETISGIGMAIIFEFTNYILEDNPICEVINSNDKSILIFLAYKNKENHWMQLSENLKVSPIYATGVSQFKTAIEEKRYSHIFISDNDYDSLKKVLEGAGCEEYTYVVTDNQHVYEDFGKCKIVRRPINCLNISDVLNDKWNKEDYIKPHKKENVTYPDAKVLVVDDNIVNLKVILSILEKYKIKADMATSGDGCLNILSNKKYDLLLLDQLMPGLSGVETLQKLRSSDNINANIPVICITAEFGADVRERLIAEGFQDYLAKPIKDFYLDRMLRMYMPADLLVISTNDIPVANGKDKENAKDKDEDKGDPLELNVSTGIELVGGSEEVYNSILVTYYQEGIKKLAEIPGMITDSDLSLYSTNVHALKSSSASIGATNLSARFKELEMAGKAGKRDIVENETPVVLDLFKQMLEKINGYMNEHGISNENEDVASNSDLGDEINLEVSTVDDLIKNLANVNLKYCEDVINDLCKNNYGKEYNNQINEIRKKFEQFDYRAVKTLLEELSSMVNIVS